MTYISPTPHQKKTKTKHNKKSAASRASPHPIGTDDRLEMDRLLEHLAKLESRFKGLEPDDPPDHYIKLTTALNATRKSFFEISEKNKEAHATDSTASHKGRLTQEDRNQKIADICALVSHISPKDFDKKKLKRRAKAKAQEKAREKAKTKGGPDDPDTVS